MKKNLDITQRKCFILWVSLSQGVLVHSRWVSSPLLRGKDLANDSPSQFELESLSWVLSGNRQRWLGGCGALLQALVSRCRLPGINRSPNPIGATERLPRPRPASLGPSSHADDQPSRRNGTSTSDGWLLYTGCFEKDSMARVFLCSGSPLPG